MRQVVRAEIRGRIEDVHTFLSDDNYGLHRGSVKLLDYGAFGAGNFIENRRGAFRRALNALAKVVDK